MAAVTYLFGFSSYGVERNYGGKKTVCYMRVFQMTFDSYGGSKMLVTGNGNWSRVTGNG